MPHRHRRRACRRRGRTPAPPSNRVLDIPADVRLVVFSDLHRCVPGRLDWPARQRTKHLYELILDYYADDPETSVALAYLEGVNDGYQDMLDGKNIRGVLRYK